MHISVKSFLRNLALTLAAVALAFLISLTATAAQLIPGRVLVKPANGIPEEVVQQAFRAGGAVQEEAIEQINLRILRVPEAATEKLIQALSRNPNFEFAEPDYLVEPGLIPNDPLFNNQWQHTRIQSASAWDITTGSAGVIVAILDTGVEASHPDLAPLMVPGWNFYDNNSDSSDVHGHGTSVAGAAVAVGNNAAGVAGVAWNCRIMPIRISAPDGMASVSTAAKALTWAADNGARVANISYRMSAYASITTAAKHMNSKGGVVTISAGNDGQLLSDPDNPHVLTVGSTTSSDALSSFSNRGNIVDLVAPGSSIVTTRRGGAYGSVSGTSFSAPITAGVAALVISVNPSLTAAGIQKILFDTADDLGAAGWDTSFGHGRVNAAKAVIAASGGTPADTTPPAVAITSPASGAVLTGSALITVSASDNVGVTKLELRLNGVLAASSSSASATFSWNTTASANGTYQLQAVAHDAAGNTGSSAIITVTVNNPPPDTTPPTAVVLSPAAGSLLSGTATVLVSGSDNVGVVKIDLFANGAFAGSVSGNGGAINWNSNGVADGLCVLEARAHDAAGNTGSHVIQVTVQNFVPDVTPPAVAITSPSHGERVKNSFKATVIASDDTAVTSVALFVNGDLVGTSSSASTVFNVNIAKLKAGPHLLTAVAHDAAGNSDTMSITIVK